MEVEQSSSSSFTSYQYPLLRPLSLLNRVNARLAAAVGIARENNGSHDHGPIRASLKVAVQTFVMHSNHRHTHSNNLGGCILTTCGSEKEYNNGDSFELYSGKTELHPENLQDVSFIFSLSLCMCLPAP